MKTLRPLLVAVLVCFSLSASAQKPQPAEATPAAPVVCEHGVKKALCSRCNPKLAAVYKAKGDWCQEHQRPESQCVLCNPELAKQGVKP